jgi:hypothetical protein
VPTANAAQCLILGSIHTNETKEYKDIYGARPGALERQTSRRGDDPCATVPPAKKKKKKIPSLAGYNSQCCGAAFAALAII